MRQLLAGSALLRLLLVEDNPGDADLLREHLAESGAASSIEVRETLGDGVKALNEGAYDLLLLDLNLPDSRGLETLDAILGARPDVPVVVLTGLADEEIGTEAIRRGAQDFLPKDHLGGPLLRRTMRHAIERHHHERELQRAERRARSYLEIADVLIVSLDRGGGISMINPAGARLLGYEHPSELEGISWFDAACTAERRQALEEGYRALLVGEGDLEHPRYPVVTRDGEERILALKISLVENDEGEVTGTLRCGLDITEREASRRRLELLNEALEAAHNAIVITNRDGVVEWANPAFTSMTGYSRSEAIGRTPGELLRSGEHDDAFYRELWDTILAGEVWQGRIVNRRKDGSLYKEEQAITPVRDASGEIAHFVAVKQDVSERVAAEDEQRRTNRALRVISAGNQALVRSSSEEEILEEMCRISVEVGGYRFAWIGYLDETDPTRIHPVAQRGEDGGYLEKIELTLSHPDDPRGPVGKAVRTGAPAVVRDLDSAVEASDWEKKAVGPGFRSKVAIPLITEGQCLGALSIYSDEPDAFDDREIEVLSEVGGDLAHGISMHRTRRRKEELENQLRQAEKLRAVGQLAGGVAHDFNNYLTVITTLVDIALGDESLGQGTRNDLREIREAARSSARLTRQLLAFSRQQVAALEVLDLGEAVRGMASMLKRLLEETIRFDLRLADEALPVRVDRGQLEQVMMNLCVNARDAMPDGGTLTIEAGTVEIVDGPAPDLDGLKPGDYVVLAVGDTGIGIADRELERLFEPFFTAKKGGTGLGLSTVYGIIKQSGGEIRVESEVGRGTRFEVYLPCRDEDEIAAPADIHPAPQAAEGKETIVLVEDHAAVRRSVSRILELSGYKVVECGTVAEALTTNEAPGLSVHLLLTDLGLPDGSGQEVGRAFLTRRPGLPIVYTSGYTPDMLNFTLELGPSEHFIEKPFDLEQLAAKVRSALGGTDHGAAEDVG